MNCEEVIPNEIVDRIEGVEIWQSFYTKERWAWYEDWMPNFDDPVEIEDFVQWCNENNVLPKSKDEYIPGDI